MLNQRGSHAPALINRQNAQRAEGDGRCRLHTGTAVENTADDLRAVRGDEGQVRKKIRVIAQNVDQIVFQAAGRMEVPEGLARRLH